MGVVIHGTDVQPRKQGGRRARWGLWHTGGLRALWVQGLGCSATARRLDFGGISKSFQANSVL